MRRGDEGERREEKARKGEKRRWRVRRRQERVEESLEGDTAAVTLELLLKARSSHCLPFPPTLALVKPRQSLGNVVCSPDPGSQSRQGK